MFIIEESVPVSELDEALSHISTALRIDEYGNRMDWRKKQLLLSSIDDLLDARLEAMDNPVSQ